MSEVTLERQMRCVQREIAMRRNVFRKRIARDDMRQDEAAEEIAAMEAVHATLQDVVRLTALLAAAEADLLEATRNADALSERVLEAHAELDELRRPGGTVNGGRA